MVKWRLDKLIQRYNAYESLLEFTGRIESELNVSNKLIAVQDSSLRVKDQIIATHSLSDTLWQKRFTNQEELTKMEKRGKRRWMIATIAVSGASIWLLSKTVD